MAEPTVHERVPISSGSDGVRHVGGTRVTLDTVVAAFEGGATPEQIVQQFPSLRLADIYMVIGYYLDNLQDVTAYLDQRRVAREVLQARLERRFDPQGIRARLLLRRTGAQAP